MNNENPFKQVIYEPEPIEESPEAVEIEIDVSEFEVKSELLARLRSLVNTREFNSLARNMIGGSTLLIAGSMHFNEPSAAQIANELSQAHASEEVWASLESDYGSTAREDIEEAMDFRMDPAEAAGLPEIDGELEPYGILVEDVQVFLRDGVPDFMSRRAEVSRIEYTTERLEINPEYHLHEHEHAAGSCSISPGGSRSVISFYPDAFGDMEGESHVSETGPVDLEQRFAGIRTFYRRYLLHELSHAIDWQNAAGPDEATRANLLHGLTEAVEHEAAMMQFGYGERITHEDPHVQMRLRAIEYFGDFLPAVLDRYETAYEQEHGLEAAVHATSSDLVWTYGSEEARAAFGSVAHTPEQEELIRDVHSSVRAVVEYVHASHPGFDFDEARAARNAVLERALWQAADEQLSERADTLPEGVWRDLAHEYIAYRFDQARDRTQDVPTYSDVQNQIRALHTLREFDERDGRTEIVAEIDAMIVRGEALAESLVNRDIEARTLSAVEGFSEDERVVWEAWAAFVNGMRDASRRGFSWVGAGSVLQARFDLFAELLHVTGGNTEAVRALALEVISASAIRQTNISDETVASVHEFFEDSHALAERPL